MKYYVAYRNREHKTAHEKTAIKNAKRRKK
jgi:hypothetical protein